MIIYCFSNTGSSGAAEWPINRVQNHRELANSDFVRGSTILSNVKAGGLAHQHFRQLCKTSGLVVSMIRQSAYRLSTRKLVDNLYAVNRPFSSSAAAGVIL